MTKLQIVTAIAVLVATASACDSSVASAQAASAGCDERYKNDEMYCRFFVEDIVGDVAHVEQVTQVPGQYWYTDQYDHTDLYAFYWCHPGNSSDTTARGVALRFTAGGGRAIEMLGTLGFEPGVNYWECNK